MRLPRAAGILLHPTSLPGPNGIGEFGPEGLHFLDLLAEAGITLWQMLPLGPTGYGDSPYQCFSSFAGNSLLIRVPGDAEAFPADRVDFPRVISSKRVLLRRATRDFEPDEQYRTFVAEQRAWLEDYALFMALDAHHAARGVWSWTGWDPALARRELPALAAARAEHAGEIFFWEFVQWCFAVQWHALKAYANQRGVRIVGDLPIFVAHHSADCWSHPRLFQLDERFEPTVVAGVPPDFFSATGQRWGNPLYDWEAMQREGFGWWIARLRQELTKSDLVRIDHFRGFAGYWEIPANCPTAIDGHWVPAPGEALFRALRAALGENLPVIAEDLGVITPDVVALRDGFGLPGMKILQFGFTGDASHAFLPHNVVPNCCVYTGTHDNDTVVGWWHHGATDRERAYASTYLQCGAHDVHRQMIRAAWLSVARLAVCPLQDLLGLGTEHRMNTPGLLDCWTWRFAWSQVGPEPAEWLARLSAAAGRAPIERLHLPPYPADRPMP
jgi:4-alpha-glucanotransferase